MFAKRSVTSSQVSQPWKPVDPTRITTLILYKKKLDLLVLKHSSSQFQKKIQYKIGFSYRSMFEVGRYFQFKYTADRAHNHNTTVYIIANHARSRPFYNIVSLIQYYSVVDVDDLAYCIDNLSDTRPIGPIKLAAQFENILHVII